MNGVELFNVIEEKMASEIEELQNLSPQSEEFKEGVDRVLGFYEQELDFLTKQIEVTNLRLEGKKLEEQTNLEKEKLKEQKKDRWVRIGTSVAEIGLPLAFYGFWMRKGFEFEETGTIASTTFKNLINRFRPTKK